MARNDDSTSAGVGLGATHEPRLVAVRTCEVRWINSGPAPAAVVEWFTRLPTTVEDRDDDYLVSPRLPGLSVKIRGRESLDVKASHGVVGALDMRGVEVAAPIESWEKLSFRPDAAPSWLIAPKDLTWQRVRKHRRIAFLTRGEPRSSTRSALADTCAAELTDFLVDGDPWWTLAIEASGEQALSATHRAATRVFAEQPPRPAFGLDSAASYAAWLERRST